MGRLIGVAFGLAISIVALLVVLGVIELDFFPAP